MKQACILIGLFINCALVKAQTWQFEMGDTWFNKNQGLKVGDSMPDISLGAVLNNNTGKTSFSQFRGKLVILDMWSTHCTSCIAFFPKMEMLQKEFGDQIQILLVNPYETESQIEAAFKRRDSGRPTFTKLPNLPSIVDAKEIFRLFPARYVPHHIWIDPNEKIRVIGPELNTYEKKITDLLAGKEVGFMKGDNNTPAFNPKIPYYRIIGAKYAPNTNAVFTSPYNGDYAAKSSGYAANIIDSQRHSIRTTWVNTSIIDIYRQLYQPQALQLHKNILIGDFFQLPVELLVKDSCLFTDEFISTTARDYKLTDTDYMKSRVCFEVIASDQLDEGARKKIIIDDLKEFVKKNYNAEIAVEYRATPCYILNRTSTTDNIKSKTNETGYKSIERNGIKAIKFTHFPIRDIFSLLDNEKLRSDARSLLGINTFILFDATGYKVPVDMTLPLVHTLNELTKALKPYNLAIIKTEKTIPWIVIKENR